MEAVAQNWQVDVNWWKSLFSELYLKTDARSMDDPDKTNLEVDFLERIFQKDKKARILDLCCGHGRHSLELSRRGYKRINASDFSSSMINLGEERASAERLEVWFVRGDAREPKYDDYWFNFVVIMGNSFGYFEDNQENQKILDEAYRVLQHGGVLVLDLADKYTLLEKFWVKPKSKHINEEAKIEVERTRQVRGDVVYTREVITSVYGQPIKDHTYCARLYSRPDISVLLRLAGFNSQDIDFQASFMEQKEDHGFMTNRMLVTAKKCK